MNEHSSRLWLTILIVLTLGVALIVLLAKKTR